MTAEALANSASSIDISPVTTEYSHVFSPFPLKHLTLRNRIIRASMGSALSAGGLVTDDLIAFNVARARGGVALSFADMGEVHWSSPGLLNLTTDDVVPGLTRMVDAVHAEGMLMFQQLLHGGPTNLPHDGSPPWSASSVPDPGLGVLPRPMTNAMIAEVTAGFVSSALRAKSAGIDGLEIHGGHGYVFSAFLSPATNKRTDEYGGDLAGRMRLLVEVVTAVRQAVGPDYVLGVRVSPDGAPGQTTAEDLVIVVGELERLGLVDYVNISLGSHYQRDLLMGGTHEPRGYQLAVSEKISRRTALPTVVTGRILSLADAEAVLRSGVADLVAMVRATIADPDLIRKTAEGRADEVRPCISCDQGCVGGLNHGRAACTVNVGAGYESRFGDANIRPTASPQRVVVVGGGPAGLEAARVAGLAGHRVTLAESESELGGQLRLLRASPHRSDVAALIPYYQRALELAGVDVRLGQHLSAADVRALEPDVVVVATGSNPRTDGFQTWRPGAPLNLSAGLQVVTAWDVFRGAEVGHAVAILDELGHYESIDIAELLVERGHEVHHVTRFGLLGANLEMRWDFIGAPHLARLMRGDFTLHTRSLIIDVGPDSVSVAPVDALHVTTPVAVDTLVVMSGQVPDRTLQLELEGAPFAVKLVGDANSPRLLQAAITEGQFAIRSLEPGWVRPKGLRFGISGSAV